MHLLVYDLHEKGKGAVVLHINIVLRINIVCGSIFEVVYIKLLAMLDNCDTANHQIVSPLASA